MALWQALAQHVEAPAAVTRARHHHFTVNRHALLVLDRRHEPSRVLVARMRGDGEAELRGLDRRDFAPAEAGILRTEDAVVVLAPDGVWMRSAAREPMDVHGDRIFAAFGWHVFVVHAATVHDAPRFAGVVARPNTGRRDADANLIGLARIDQHRADARLLAAGDAHPLLALGHEPQSFNERPTFARVVGAKQPAGHGAGPQPAGHETRFKRPDLAERPGMRIVSRAIGLGRKRRHAELAPGIAFAFPEMRAEMAEIERGVERSIER